MEYLKDRIEDSMGTSFGPTTTRPSTTSKDEQTLREYQVFRHIIGKNAKEDELIYQEDDEKYSVSFGKSKTGKYIFIACYSSMTSEFLWLDNDSKSSCCFSSTQTWAFV